MQRAWWVTVVLGVLVGLLSFWLYGLHLLVPVTVTLVSAALLRGLAPPRVQPLVAGVSVLWGHQAWILLGLGFMGAPGPWALAVDLAPCAALLFLSAFLLSRPSSRWILLLNLLLGLLLLVNVWMFLFAPQIPRLPLSLHILLRCAAPILLNLGWEHFQAESFQAEPPRAPAFQVSHWGFPAALLLTIWSRVLVDQAMAPPPKPPAETRSLKGRVELVGDDYEVGAYTRVDFRVNGEPVKLSERGEYFVPEIPWHAVQLAVSHPDTVEKSAFAVVPAEQTRSSTAPDLKLTLLGRITGVVGSELYSQRMEDPASIELDSLGINASVDAYGQFSIGPMPVGSYAAVISAPGHETLRRELTAFPPQKPYISRTFELFLVQASNEHGCVPKASAPGPLREVLETRLPRLQPANGVERWRLRVHPCRAGTLTDIRVRASPKERPYSSQHWSAGLGRAVGVAQASRPGLLLNEAPDGPVRIPVRARQPLVLYVGERLDPGTTYEIWLRYEDRSHDLALLSIPR